MRRRSSRQDAPGSTISGRLMARPEPRGKLPSGPATACLWCGHGHIGEMVCGFSSSKESVCLCQVRQGREGDAT